MRKIVLSLVAMLGFATMATAQVTEVTGTIRTTNGTPIAGVVVTDGHTVTATDAEGKYAFTRHEEAAYVYYSLPAEYRVPLRQGHPCFYKKLTDDKVYDFVLQPLKGVLTLAFPRAVIYRGQSSVLTIRVPVWKHETGC